MNDPHMEVRVRGLLAIYSQVCTDAVRVWVSLLGFGDRRCGGEIDLMTDQRKAF